MESLERLLAEHAFLRGLSNEQQGLLVSCVRNLRFEKGSYLLRSGEPAERFYLLRHGRVALESDVPGRGTVQMETLSAGQVLGLSWVIEPYRVKLDARAVEPVVALAFDGTCLRGKLEADHDLGFLMLRRLLEEAVKRLERVRLQRLDIYKAEG